MTKLDVFYLNLFNLLELRKNLILIMKLFFFLKELISCIWVKIPIFRFKVYSEPMVQKLF
jgi:hypothetical protein